MAAASRPCIRFGREICGDLYSAERREWWLSNGLGGYASGTVAETLSRRYHGLLIAPLYPPLGRVLTFAKADAELIDDDRHWPMYTNRWSGGAIHPAGHIHIESFHLDGRLPVWQYRYGDVVIEKRIWMVQGANITRIAWRMLGNLSRPLRLRVALMLSNRDHHAVTQADTQKPRLLPDASGEPRLQVLYGGLPALELLVDGGHFEPDEEWIRHFDLPIERERGLEDSDQHFRIGYANLDLHAGLWCGVSVSAERLTSDRLADSLSAAKKHQDDILASFERTRAKSASVPAWIRQLVLAADSFMITRPQADGSPGESVIAGYPWFGEWGRDTMVCITGLTLVTGRFDSARRILETYAKFLDGGMLPNVFTGSGEQAEYNTVDATLWYIEAWRAYIDATGDIDALRRVFPLLREVIAAHRRGVRYGIGVDSSDGLLRAGEPGVQLTWMDAKLGDWVVTPRIGKPVEVNALWFNALKSMQSFARLLKEDDALYAGMAHLAACGFSRFIRPDGMGLLDVIDGPDGDDASIRPNQILAVSLHYSPLSPSARRQVVEICGRTLLTSYGMRSLAPGQTGYREVYLGGVWERDSAYHQGTAWSWLLGHYALAEFRTHGDAALALSRLEPIADHLLDVGLGTISEIFDAEPPHKPRGAPSQAWSVASTLEAWWNIQRQAR